MATSILILPIRPTNAEVGSNTDSNTYATGSASEVSGDTYLVGFVVKGPADADPTTGTVTGTNGYNGTWTSVGTSVARVSNVGYRLSVYWSVATSNSAGVITYTAGSSEVELAGCVYLMRFPNVHATPIVQTKTNTSNAATSLTVTLDNALTSSANLVVCFFATTSGSSTVTVGSSYQRAAGNSIATSDGLTLMAVFGSGIAPTASWSSAGCMGVACELANANSVAAAGRGTGPGLQGL